MSLLELAERCEAAAGPDRELDAAIYEGVTVASGHSVSRDGNGFRVQRHGDDTFCTVKPDWVLSYTGSLDAAMALVPESDDSRAVFWRLGNDGEGGNPGDFRAEVLIASTYAAHQYAGLADTAPLALCAAALRTRAANTGSTNE